MNDFKRKATKFLEEWKTRPDRKPLIVRGARQVGKTFLINTFGSQNYQNYIYLNLEKIEIKRLFNNELSLAEFKLVLKTQLKYELIPNQTLLFIDEIQNSPSLFNLLRFFYEELNEIDVIVAGSLLETRIHDGLFNIPVGRVEFLFIHPFNFYEFLSAIKKDELIEYINNIKIGDNVIELIHKSLIKYYYDYMIIGGMPGAIRGYLNHNQLEKDNEFYSSIMLTYSEDVRKYSNETGRKYIESVLENSTKLAGSIYSYTNFGDSGFSSREISTAFNKLESAMLINQISATSSTALPIQSKNRRQKKLVFLDTGLVNFDNGLGLNNKISEYQAIYKGRIFEQVIGQELISIFDMSQIKLYYWAKDKTKGTAEVDYCIQYKDKIVGIEVKSRVGSTLRSLLSFGDIVENNILVRVYGDRPILEKVIVNNKSYKILSIPYYLLLRLNDFLD